MSLNGTDLELRKSVRDRSPSYKALDNLKTQALRELRYACSKSPATYFTNNDPGNLGQQVALVKELKNQFSKASYALADHYFKQKAFDEIERERQERRTILRETNEYVKCVNDILEENNFQVVSEIYTHSVVSGAGAPEDNSLGARLKARDWVDNSPHGPELSDAVGGDPASSGAGVEAFGGGGDSQARVLEKVQGSTVVPNVTITCPDATSYGPFRNIQISGDPGPGIGTTFSTAPCSFPNINAPCFTQPFSRVKSAAVPALMGSSQNSFRDPDNFPGVSLPPANSHAAAAYCDPAQANLDSGNIGHPVTGCSGADVPLSEKTAVQIFRSGVPNTQDDSMLIMYLATHNITRDAIQKFDGCAYHFWPWVEQVRARIRHLNLPAVEILHVIQ